MSDVIKCYFCGRYYQINKRHKCKQGERFSYNQGKIDGFEAAYERINKVMDRIIKEQSK